jgi:DNA primase
LEDVSPVRQSDGTPITRKLPDEFEFYNKASKWNPPYLEYLFSRGITWEQIVMHEIGYCDSGRYSLRVVVPITLGRELCSFVARSIVAGKRVTSMPNGKPGLFGSNLAYPKIGPAIIAEGWADALAIERSGYANVMSAQTNHIHPTQFEYLKQFGSIVVVPDGDSGGEMFIDSLAQYVDQHSISIAKPPQDKDPGDMTDEEIVKCIESSKPWEPTTQTRTIELIY